MKPIREPRDSLFNDHSKFFINGYFENPLFYSIKPFARNMVKLKRIVNLSDITLMI